MAAIFQTTFSNGFSWMKLFDFSNKNSLKFVSWGRINNIPALVEIMAWRRPRDKPLSEPMMVSSLTHICVTRPQWVKNADDNIVAALGPEKDQSGSHLLHMSVSYIAVTSWWARWHFQLPASRPSQRVSNAENVSIWWRHHEHKRSGLAFHREPWARPPNFGYRYHLGWIILIVIFG